TSDDTATTELVAWSSSTSGGGVAAGAGVGAGPGGVAAVSAAAVGAASFRPHAAAVIEATISQPARFHIAPSSHVLMAARSRRILTVEVDRQGSRDHGDRAGRIGRR